MIRYFYSFHHRVNNFFPKIFFHLPSSSFKKVFKIDSKKIFQILIKKKERKVYEKLKFISPFIVFSISKHNGKSQINALVVCEQNDQILILEIAEVFFVFRPFLLPSFPVDLIYGPDFV